ncbi:putative superfamily III holin-X [Algoriphagus boseongensis]|uniref:Putative superfamily III holin-X n=1 Tax=Algoriphagus boseongensis TaxID=1442587 RepID=A0A4R6T5K5_9BACT|nr:phage holin family protein [Algoriphagus boseongensis]TDQ17289.1 putative superfamily III holin-X [Algoriphagus boseongensis]
MLKIGEIVQTLKGIVETRIGMVKQEIQEEFLTILSRMILLIIMGSMIFMSFIFISLSVAFFLSQVTKSPYLGFLIVALVYLMLVLILYVSRDSLRLQEKTGTALNNFIFRRIKKNKESGDE